MIQFSILICSLFSRKDKLNELLETLLPQIGEYYTEKIDSVNKESIKYTGSAVEIIIHTDNKQIPVGAKRNNLMRSALGKYIAFVDDDDWIAEDYVRQIVDKIITAQTDCIVFDAERFVNGVFDRQVKYGVEYRKDYNDKQFYYRIPNHLMVLKRQIALQRSYKPISFGEDSIYARAIFPHIKTQSRIDKVLYRYMFDSKKTETQK